MARIRTLKPDSALSLSMQGVSIEARYFFQNLWCHLDDEGRSEWLPKMVLGLLFPSEDDPYTVDDLNRWVDELESKDFMLQRYVVDGKQYVWAPGFTSHQVINRPSFSKCPSFEDSRRTHGGLTDGSLPEKEKEKEKEMEMEKEKEMEMEMEKEMVPLEIVVAQLTEAQTAPEDYWEEFLSQYPRRLGDLGKKKGRDKFLQLIKAKTDPAQMIDGARRYSLFLATTGKIGTEFVKQIPTFLNAKAWEEEFEVDVGSKPQAVDHLRRIRAEREAREARACN